MKRLCFLFPGQGAQYVGMGKSFYDAYPIAKETFQEADEILGENLSKIIFSGPEDVLTATKHSQPAIFVTSMALLNVLKKHFQLPDPVCAAGLSLGEYTALTAAGVFSFTDALKLVALRAKAMHSSCEKTRGGMLVILGLADDQVRNMIHDLHLPHDIWCANFNCPSQVVVSGTLKGVEAAREAALASGAKRVLPLQVHGAFHSGLMKDAENELKMALEGISFHKSPIHVAMNVTGTWAENTEEIRRLLVKQVTASVEWHKCVKTCEELNVSHFIEIGCGKTLCGLNKRIGVTSPCISVETIDDLKLLEEALIHG